MKIKDIECKLIKFKLRQTSATAYGSADEVENVIVKITTSNGLTGWGNCAPDPIVTGEKPGEIKNVIDNQLKPTLIGKDPLQIEYINQLLFFETSIEKFPSAIAGVDIALYDLLGKIARLPLYKLLGFYREKILTSITVSLIPLDAALDCARQYLQQGFKSLKIKIGQGLEQDLERIAKIYEIVRDKSIEIRLDANQAYEPGQALQLVRLIAEQKFDIAFLEQPCKASHIYALKEITNQSPIPIMADESALNVQDTLIIAQEQAAHLINIKLMKAGGITNARMMDRVAGLTGMPTMIGCMDESVISIAAGLHLALSSANVAYADLDGHLDIIDDIATGGFEIQDGYLLPLDQPGLGVQINKF